MTGYLYYHTTQNSKFEKLIRWSQSRVWQKRPTEHRKKEELQFKPSKNIVE